VTPLFDLLLAIPLRVLTASSLQSEDGYSPEEYWPNGVRRAADGTDAVPHCTVLFYRERASWERTASGKCRPRRSGISARARALARPTLESDCGLELPRPTVPGTDGSRDWHAGHRQAKAFQGYAPGMAELGCGVQMLLWGSVSYFSCAHGMGWSTYWGVSQRDTVPGPDT